MKIDKQKISLIFFVYWPNKAGFYTGEAEIDQGGNWSRQKLVKAETGQGGNWSVRRLVNVETG